MHQPSTPSVQVVPTRRRRGFNKKPAAAASLITCLPRDVLASILLGLPASDLRRFRRVCKEWRDTISDPVFIAAHMVHGPRTPTHTVVFYPGQHSGDKEPLNGGGFLFDEQWRLTARFTVDESVDMIGTCKGLLCFRDRLRGVINVVEPFDGESITLPLPSSQGAAGTCSTRAYCFGFDAAARRYKIVYVAFDAAAATTTQELQVFAVGADKDWRTVCFSCAAHGLSYDFPACGGNGGVYWHSKAADGTIKNVRFDLATESITSAQGRVDGRRPEGRILCSSVPWVSHRFVIGIKWFGEWEDGSWPGNVNAVAHDVYVPAPPLREGLRLPGPHALQRGHLILQDKDGDLRAQTINGSRGSYLYVWLNVGSKPLVEIGSKDEDPIPAERNQFVPVRGRHWPTKEPAPIGSNSKVDAITMCGSGGSVKKNAMVGGADAAAATACLLPRDVLANILVRLPASDLRCFRRVSKEWRKIISDPAFVDEHTVHGPRTPVQTIVFLPGQIQSHKHSEYGSGFLFDDQWRLTATFSAARFDDMIGPCNGLLCFLDGCYRRRAIYVVDPSTGETLTLPCPPMTDRWRDYSAYCFGFDPRSRRYKIFHQGSRYKQDQMYLYTIGRGREKEWRRVEVEYAGSTQGASYSTGDLVFAHGSVYWCVVRDRLAHLVRFDLATEEVTSESIAGSIELGKNLVVMPDSNAGVCGMTRGVGWAEESQTKIMRACGGHPTTPPNNNIIIIQPHGRRLALPHALQRDHLLLNDYLDKGLYAHTIAPASNELGHGKLLVEACKEDRAASCTTRGLFIPSQVNQKPSAIPRLNGFVGHHPRVFCYGQNNYL